MPTPPSRGSVTPRGAFGWRIHPITGVRAHHNGEDTIGDGNYSPVNGRVVFCGWDNTGAGFGNTVAVKETGVDAVWWMAHFKSISVKLGDIVKEGQWLGTIGSTGASTGIHVHTERRQGGRNVPRSGTATNPRHYYTSPAGGPTENIEEDRKIMTTGNLYQYPTNGPRTARTGTIPAGGVTSTFRGKQGDLFWEREPGAVLYLVPSTEQYNRLVSAGLLPLTMDAAEIDGMCEHQGVTASPWLSVCQIQATVDISSLPNKQELGQALTSTVALVNDHADGNKDAIIAAMPTGSGGGSSSYDLSLTIDEIPGTATGTATAN